MNRFLVGKNDFLLDGEPFKVISGAMHYFRVPREYWRDRLLKIKACGFNTIETYTAWNLHEKNEGEYDFSGNLDLKAYLQLINELGMYAIVRPGPYICSEWEFGGFPWWLLRYDDIELRCMNDRYLEKVDRYFDQLIPIIASEQIDNGGAVIMVQVENEYGSYGDDTEYMRYLAAGLNSRGITTALFTSDGDCDMMLTGGTLPGVHKTVNFGSRAEKCFKNLRRHQPQGPLMCAEFWNGWFDHWGEKHHKTDPKTATQNLKEILDLGGNVSVYMMHGGTNFGYMNGANCSEEKYEPTISSYDDDAPVNEYGGLTEKYKLFKELLGSYGYKNDVEVSEPVTKFYPPVEFKETADFIAAKNILSSPIDSTVPVNMEALGIGYGYVLYETFIRGPREKQGLYIDAHDRAYVFVNGKFAGVQYRNDKKGKIKLEVPEEGVTLSILVENMGRTNYGALMKDKKGIVAPVRLGGQLLYHWKNYPLGLEDLSEIEYERSNNPKFKKRPQLLRAVFNIEGKPEDTFVDTGLFKKGQVWVNGIMLSKYWEKGPQKTAYLPAVFLKEGKNEIVVLELEGYKKARVEFPDNPDLG